MVAARGQSGFPEGGPARVAGATESPWQFSMGLRGRRLSASFGPPGPIDSRSFYVPKSNAGKDDVGLVTRPDQQVIYDDGFAGPDDIFMNPGTGAPVAVGEGTMLIDSASQFTPAIRPAGRSFVLPGSVRFHTYATLYSYESNFDSQEVAAAAYAVGPYAQLRREVAQWESASLGVTLAWSFMMFDAGTAPQIVSRQTLTELRKDIFFEYRYATLMTELLAPPGQSIGGGGGSGIIYDADIVYDNQRPSLTGRPPAPSKSSREKQSRRSVANLTAVSQNHLDVNFSDLGLTADWSFAPLPWCQIGIAAGPTLNLLNYDYLNRTQWYLNGRRFEASQFSHSDTLFKVGARAGLHLLCHLNKSGSVYLELAGGYDWLGAVELNLGGRTVEIDASSWTGQCGIGIRF